jgi:hypothetical protein
MSVKNIKAKVKKLQSAIKRPMPRRARPVLYTVPATAAEEEREEAMAEALARWQSEHSDYEGRGPSIFLCLEVGPL